MDPGQRLDWFEHPLLGAAFISWYAMLCSGIFGDKALINPANRRLTN